MSGLLQKLSFMPYRPTLVDLQPGASYDPVVSADVLLNVTPTSGGTTKSRGGYRAWKTAEFSFIASTGHTPAACFVGDLGDTGEFLVFSVDNPGGSGLNPQQNFYIHGTDTRDTSTGGATGVYGAISDFVVAESRLYITRPGKHPMSWRPVSGFSVENSIPQCRFIIEHKSRLIAVGLKNAPNAIAWSSANQLTQFDRGTSGLLPVGSGSGEVLTGGYAYYGEVILTTTQGIYRFQFTNDALGFSLTEISGVVGCISHRSITQVVNDLYFLSEAGVHSLRRTQAYGDLDKSIVSPELAGLFAKLRGSSLERADAVYDSSKGLFYISIPVPLSVASSLGLSHDDWSPSAGSAVTRTVLLVQEVASGRWAVHDLPVGPMAIMRNKRGPMLSQFVVGGMAFDDGVSFGRMETGDSFDMTENVHGRETNHSRYISGRREFLSVIRTVPIDAGEPGQLKDWRRIEIYFRSGAAATAKLRYVLDQKFDDSATLRDFHELSFYLSPTSTSRAWLDNGGAGWTLGDGKFFTDPEWQAEKVSLDIPGHGRQIVIEIQVDSRPFELLGFELFFLPMTSDTYDDVSAEDQILIESGTESLLSGGFTDGFDDGFG